MPFTAAELSNIANATLDYKMNRGKVFTQNIQSKPMLAAFDAAAGTFSGGNGDVSLLVKSGEGGLELQGYTHDDQVNYGNPTGIKRVAFPWKEHHIGLGLTHTELKMDGITVIEESPGEQRTTPKDGRETISLANIFEEKLDEMAEDYAQQMDELIHGDGTSDTKALAGIGAFILKDPDAGSTGGISRSTNSWWRNRARTTANGNPITASAANGGALLQVLQADSRQLSRFARGGTRNRMFAGSDFIGAMEMELRANGNYTDSGFMRAGSTDGGMGEITFKGKKLEYDPTLDDMGESKFMYSIDMRRIRLLYMQGEKMKRASPARPYDRYVIFKAITSTCVLVAQQLNTSAVYEIT